MAARVLSNLPLSPVVLCSLAKRFRSRSRIASLRLRYFPVAIFVVSLMWCVGIVAQEPSQPKTESEQEQTATNQNQSLRFPSAPSEKYRTTPALAIIANIPPSITNSATSMPNFAWLALPRRVRPILCGCCLLPPWRSSLWFTFFF